MGDDGEREPDYRWTLASERTYLAYVRTSLALIAAGVAVVAVLDHGPERLRQVLAVLLVLAGLSVALAGRHRWTQIDAAMRRGEPLPRSRVAVWLGVVMVGVAAAAVILVLLS